MIDKTLSVQNAPTVKEGKKAQETQTVSDAFEAILGMMLAQTVNMVQDTSIPLGITGQGIGVQDEGIMAGQGIGVQDEGIMAGQGAGIQNESGITGQAASDVLLSMMKDTAQGLQGTSINDGFDALMEGVGQTGTQEVQNITPFQNKEAVQILQDSQPAGSVNAAAVKANTGVKDEVTVPVEALNNLLSSKIDTRSDSKTGINDKPAQDKQGEDKNKGSTVMHQDILTDSAGQDGANTAEVDKASETGKDSDPVRMNTSKKYDVSIKASGTGNNEKDSGQVRVPDKYHGITQFLLNSTQGEKNTVQQAMGNSKLLEAAGRDDVLNQILDKIKVTGDKNISELRVSLKPEELGEVSIRLVLEKGAMTGRIMVENSQVKSLIESNLQSIRDTLKSQNINVSDVNVSVGLGGGNPGQEQKFYQNKWNYNKNKISGFSISSQADGIRPETVSGYGSSLNLLA